MEDLFSLAIIWIAVFVAHYLAGKTRLTPVLWFLAMGCLLVNLGLLPEKPGVFIEVTSEVVPAFKPAVPIVIFQNDDSIVSPCIPDDFLTV